MKRSAFLPAMDDLELGTDVHFGTPERREVHQRYRLFGTHAIARNDANEESVPVTSHGETQRRSPCCEKAETRILNDLETPNKVPVSGKQSMETLLDQI